MKFGKGNLLGVTGNDSCNTGNYVILAVFTNGLVFYISKVNKQSPVSWNSGRQA